MSTNSNNKRCNIYFCEIKSKMGFMKHFIRDGIGIAGKTLMNAADVYSGGLASKLTDKGLNAIQKNSGIIGKVAGGIGRFVLSDSFRDKMSNAANQAIKYLPNGKVKDTLKSLNDSAQNKFNSIVQPKRLNHSSKRRHKVRARDLY